MGCVAPNGTTRSRFINHSMRGESGVDRIHHIDTDRLSCRIAGYADEFEPERWLPPDENPNDVGRAVPLTFSATDQTLQQADLTSWPDPRRVGIVLGSGGGPVDFVEEQYRWYFTGEGDLSVYNVPSSTIGNLAGDLSIRVDARGPSHLVSTGCTSSSDAFGHALMLLRSGRVDCVLCGGVDTPITPGIILGFEKLRILASGWNDRPRQASRPFDARRNGFVPGEGCWMFLLETRNHLEERNGPEPMAELAGYASTCDAHHRVRMREDNADAARAIHRALEDAGCGAKQVDYIQAHGTSTELNDRVEAALFRSVFDPVPPISSVKSLIGHPQGASGAAGAAITIASLRRDRLSPTINQEEDDPECDIDCVPNTAREHPTDVALINCLSFGSRNSVLVLRSPDHGG